MVLDLKFLGAAITAIVIAAVFGSPTAAAVVTVPVLAALCAVGALAAVSST